MTAEELSAITTEVKTFATNLDLSYEQKEPLKALLADKYPNLQKFRAKNPNISRHALAQRVATIRPSGRDKVVAFSRAVHEMGCRDGTSQGFLRAQTSRLSLSFLGWKCLQALSGRCVIGDDREFRALVARNL